MFLVVSDSFKASSANPTMPEKLDRTKTWARLLYTLIPEEYLQICFDEAFRAHRSKFAINAYDIRNAWFETVLPALEKNEAGKRADEIKKNPSLACKNNKFHIVAAVGSAALVKVDLFQSGKDSFAPCPICRADEYAKWRKNQIALYGEHQPKTPILRPNFGDGRELRNTPSNPFMPSIEVLSYQRAVLEKIDTPEAAKLEKLHNDLVDRLEPKNGEREKLYIKYDTGAETFMSRTHHAKTYSPSVVRNLIKNYEQILAERTVSTDANV